MAFLSGKILTILVALGAGLALFGLLLTYSGQLTNYKLAVDLAIAANVTTGTPGEGSLSASGTRASLAGYTPYGAVGGLAQYETNFWQVGFIFVGIATTVGAAGNSQHRFPFACAALLFAGTVAFTSFFQWVYYLMRADFAAKQLGSACNGASIYDSRACSASSLFNAGVFFVWIGAIVQVVVAVAYILEGWGQEGEASGRNYSTPALNARSPPPASSSGHSSVQQGGRPDTVQGSRPETVNSDASHNV